MQGGRRHHHPRGECLQQKSGLGHEDEDGEQAWDRDRLELHRLMI